MQALERDYRELRPEIMQRKERFAKVKDELTSVCSQLYLQGKDINWCSTPHSIMVIHRIGGPYKQYSDHFIAGIERDHQAMKALLKDLKKHVTEKAA